MTSRLAIGTVQFGLNYGIANRTGQVPLAMAQRILARARQQGLNTLDTAMVYGDSEFLLGQVGVTDWDVITKLPSLPVHGDEMLPWMRREVESSLQRLGISQLSGLLLHAPQQLLEPDGAILYRALHTLKAEGLTRRIGYSIYSPEDLELLCPAFPPDLIQAPFNIVDRSLVASGWLECLSQQGIAVHVRSVFLQGLLLMAVSERPPVFQRWQGLWQKWQEWLAQVQLSPLQACLGFVLSHPLIERVVVGVDNETQLEQILQASVLSVPDYPPDLVCDDPLLIYPSHWSQL